MGQERAWHAFHFNWLYFTVISTAGGAFAAVQRIVTDAGRGRSSGLRKASWRSCPVAFVMLLVILLFGREHIFTWAGREAITVQEKAFYLAPAFFITRGIVIFGLITFLQLWFVYNSVRLDVAVLPEYGAKWAAGIRARMRAGFGDERRELHSQHSLQGKVARRGDHDVRAGLVHHGVGLFHDALAALPADDVRLDRVHGRLGVNMIMASALLCMWWRKHLDAEDLVTDAHFWDLGKLGFAFTAFFGYISFSQYLVIWYGNMPEETFFYRLRLIGAWKNVTLLTAIFAFVLPFFGLISKAAKMYKPTFVLFAVCSLLGIYLHRYIEVYPSIYGETDSLPYGIWEILIRSGSSASGDCATRPSWTRSPSCASS